MVLIQERSPGRSRTRYEFKPSPHSSHMLVLAALPDQGRGRTILDLGCSGGDLSRLLVERGFVVTSVDKPGNPRPELPAGVRFIEADLDAGLPAALAQPFDFIICADVLEHLKEPEGFLVSVAGVLAPGGRLVASLPNSGNIYFRLNVLMGRFPAHDRGLFDRTHLHFYMWRGWKELFGNAGFRVESVRPTTVPFSLAFPRLAKSALVRGMESCYHWFARAWMKLFAYQFVVIACRAEGQS
jgi:SAM-dependent methyltransferase